MVSYQNVVRLPFAYSNPPLIPLPVCTPLSHAVVHLCTSFIQRQTPLRAPRLLPSMQPARSRPPAGFATHHVSWMTPTSGHLSRRSATCETLERRLQGRVVRLDIECEGAACGWLPRVSEAGRRGCEQPCVGCTYRGPGLTVSEITSSSRMLEAADASIRSLSHSAWHDTDRPAHSSPVKYW